MFWHNNYELLKRGFDLEALKNIPIHEYYGYVDELNKEIEAKRNQQQADQNAGPQMGPQ